MVRPTVKPGAQPRARAAAKPDHPPHPGHDAHAKLPPPPKGKLAPLRAPKPVVAAPPVNRWPATLEATTTRYGFTAKQNKSAQSVLASCRKRAEAHMTAKEVDYAKANQLADPKAKAVQLKKLNTKIDKLYHEMNLRVDSIASIEQRLASQAAAKKTPAEMKPTERKPAEKTEPKKTTAKADPGKPGT